MTRSRILAAAQTVPVRGDVDANRDQHMRLAALAADADAGVLVFPELSLTGYELDLGAALAFEASDARLTPLADAARTSGVTLVAGAPVRVEGRLHIGAFVLTPGGARDVYTKHHLAAFSPRDGPAGFEPITEPSVFEPGTLDPLVAVGDTTAGHRAACPLRAAVRSWSAEGKCLVEADAAGAGIVVARESDAGWSGKAMRLGGA